MINFGLMAEKVFDETQFNGVTGIILGSGLGKFADILNEKNINECWGIYESDYIFNKFQGYEKVCVEYNSVF